jgi:flagellar motor switch protein FliN/FliY
MTMTQEEIDALISSGDLDTDNTDAASEATDAATSVSSADFDEMDFDSSSSSGGGGGGYSQLDSKLELLYDLQLPVSIELGRTNMLIRNILRLGRGSVVEFDKLVSEPVDILVNGKKIAEGEVVVIDKHFGIRITTLVDPAERLKGLRS